MIPRIELLSDGSVRLAGLPPWYAIALKSIPRLLGGEQPDGVKARLFPFPSGDRELREEWARLVHPELFAALATAKEIVEKDMESLAIRDDAFAVTIPETHRNGWISAINAARLALAERFGIGKEEMARDVPCEDATKEAARLRIDMLAHVQQLLIEGF